MESQKVFVAGHPMAYFRTGRGETVLLVHGTLTNSVIWREVAPLLAARRQVVVVDLLGCGESTNPMRLSLSAKAQADYLAELVQWLGIGPVHFVGHEVGGAIGQVLAVRHPKILRSLTLVNSVAGELWPVRPITGLRLPIARQLLLSMCDAGLGDWFVRSALYHREKATPALMRALRSPLQTLPGRRAAIHFARDLDSAELTSIAPDLSRLSIPVQVVWGDADRYLPRATPERLLASFPGAKLHRIQTAGHLVPIDEPERLAEILLDGSS
ncbi:MAG: alpha/beta hydrolase [Anaeromyxobacteraceae bacterium]